MSKQYKTCKDCFHFYGVVEDMNGEVGMCDLQSSEYPNYKVAGETACDKFNAPTVFDHITQSVETLAEKLVYWEHDDWGSWWTSNVLDEEYSTPAEAIAATIEKLKKEWSNE